MLRLVKRLMLRMKLAHARHQLRYWKSDCHNYTHAWARFMCDFWSDEIETLELDLAELNAKPDPSDETENLSKRSIGPLFSRH